jgi:hypothetical protein
MLTRVVIEVTLDYGFSSVKDRCADLQEPGCLDRFGRPDSLGVGDFPAV